MTYTTDPIGGYGLIILTPNYVKVYINDAEVWEQSYSPSDARDNDFFVNLLNNYIVNNIPIKLTLEVIFTAQYGRIDPAGQNMSISTRIITTRQQ